MADQQQQIEVYDVCNTLYDSNTTFDFLRFFLAKEAGFFKRFFFKNLSFKYSPLFIFNFILSRISGQDVGRKLAVGLLKGYAVDKVNALAGEFYDTFLVHKKIDETFRLLNTSSKQRIVLISNSIEPVIAVIAKRLGLEYYATRLEADQEGRLTGRIGEDLHSRKKQIFTKYFAAGTRIEKMVTDNKSDKDILALAKNKIVVIYKPGDKAFWNHLNPVYIEKF